MRKEILQRERKKEKHYMKMNKSHRKKIENNK
jgi:hypothetical protein